MDRKNVFSGAKLESAKDVGDPYYTATGQPLRTTGSFDVAWTSANGHSENTTHINAPDAMPR